ncbi:efflux RND transporter periplasmic adaptor subunit [Nibrella saemangeumensis]|uniref:Efflux RND transporter periplasmic adaptor subunit n=1 Tax=Nibrella saemangeumensis TaxID=1084526 RepID=A0ABP8MMX0_9BACT
MNKITKRIITFAVILMVISMAFYPKLKSLSKSESAGEGPKAEAQAGAGSMPKTVAQAGPAAGVATPVEVMVVNANMLDEKLLTTGTIIANEEVDIRSEVSGRVTGIYFREGDYVQQGAVLLRINDADLQAQLQKLNFNKKLAEDNESRQKRLLEKEAISRQEYEISQTNLNSILADIENLKAQIAKTVLRAPFNGTIGLRYISNGSYISPSSRIATLTNTNPAKLDFSIPAKYASVVRKGNRIQFTVEGSGDQRTGTVYAVEPKVDPNTRTMLLRAVSPNSDRTLVPGAFARIELVLNSRGNAIVVPTEAVVPEVTGQKVFVVRNHKVESVPVEIGTRTDRNVEIRKGLQQGDSLITSGIQMVKPGSEVAIKNIL